MYHTQGYQQKNMYIVTQGPMRNTVNDFWRMIWEKQVEVVVMLTKIEERGKVCTHYHSMKSVQQSTVQYNMLVF